MFKLQTSRLLVNKEQYIWRILFIDDDEDDYVLVREMLLESREGRFLLEWAPSYEEGRRAIESDPSYDAVIVDYDMGIHTGIEIIRAAVENKYPAPLLLLTGRGTYEVDVEAMQAGAADYLSKSEINAVFLERAIRYAIERKKNELALRESEQRFRAIFDNRHSSMLLIDPATSIIVDANQAACTFYGWPRDILVGMKITSINTLPPDQVMNRMDLARSSPSSVRFHFKHRIANGEIRDVEVHSGPVKIGNQQLLFSIITDVTEHVKTQHALIENQARLCDANEHLKYALHAANLGIWSVGIDGKNFKGDAVTRRMLGLLPDEPLPDRATAARFVHPDDLAIIDQAFQQVLAQAGSFEIEYRVLHPTGVLGWVYCVGGLDPERKHLHGVIRDISERKKAEQARKNGAGHTAD